ncbi:initiator tRNA phosphoribosyl transferase family protein [Aspergillus clavatus NRRL 1]|uniref:tRNA a64-2'-o-ribosylphosphate transferase n=1 Tax=Aspergillus clavatus (strain ATCC 1007 / CBS 513.65 / DSM 816 / NCTC 3887 / NRRL 1 / QM 1276 / 107) TaxID=344612 RepID=A1CAM8_ASPCL|nr:tRNA a64-2'-o-ribosylphosphate transferase [Aspergillus clavatus NRRL 1]EAW12796.1 tRNA a64-2'-o-ribosylphosphate transferase [Aspergillus clavatus NRRL 1]
MEDRSDPFPVSVSSLHFPSAVQSISQTLSSLRRSALSISNRLRSIESDAAFVGEVADHYGLPLVANERCGSWYIPPEIKSGSAYFKSTDGHTGQWDFSFRRLNLQILPIARKHGGCIIVDSTRRGKLMPDALSKTVPIWCAVMNRALFPSDTAYHAVQLPPNFLGASEGSQIELRIGGFVKSLKDLKLDLDDLRQQLGKPIRIAWANRSYFHPTDLHKGAGYNLFVLCSASKRVHGAEISEGGYIQGAGDDSEGWAHGLTPQVFWANKATLLRTAEEDLPDLIEELLQEHQSQDSSQQATLVAPTRNLYISQTNACLNDSGGRYDLIIDCNGNPETSEQNPKRLCLGCRSSKLGSRDLRQQLDKVRDFVGSQLASDPSRSLLVTCETGKDLSAGTLLAIICLFYDDEGAFTTTPVKRSIDKQFIRRRLAWIVSSKHEVNPSRPTLQSVNAFLMERPDY